MTVTIFEAKPPCLFSSQSEWMQPNQRDLTPSCFLRGVLSLKDELTPVSAPGILRNRIDVVGRKLNVPSIE